MNKLTKAIITLTCTFAFISQASANHHIQADNTISTQLCAAAINGNRAVMFNAIKASGYSKQFVVNNIKCNNKDLMSFIEQYGHASAAMKKMLTTGINIKNAN